MLLERDYLKLRHETTWLLIEAALRVNYRNKVSKIATPLERKISKLFLKHGVAFIKVFAGFKSQFKESFLDDDLAAIFDVTSPAQDLATLLQTSVESALLAGAKSLLEELDLTDIVFNLKNPRAVDYITNYGANRVKGIDDTSLKVLRGILNEATDNGWSYNKTAKAIQKQFGDWSKKRAKLIAVTEVGNAYQEGNLIVGKDLQAAGLQMEKSWLTRNDNRVDTEHCLKNQEQGWISVDQPFQSGAERPLDHPGCRCVLLFRRVEGGKVVKQTPKPVTTKTVNDIADSDLQTAIKDAISDLYKRTSVWSGIVHFDKSETCVGFINMKTGDITVNEDVYRDHHDRAFKTLVHEMFHSVSQAFADPNIKKYIGWEEAVVEKLARIHVEEVAKTTGYTINDIDKLKETYKTHPYNRYVGALENARMLAGVKTDEFYKTLLGMNIQQRRDYVKRALVKKLGSSRGNREWRETDLRISGLAALKG